MNFGQAIEAMKRGDRVFREGWNEKGMFVWIAVVIATESPEGIPQGISNVRPCLVIKDAQEMCKPGWLPTPDDMLADDWRTFAPPLRN